MQATLKQPVAFAGIGLFTGVPCSIRLVPATANTGLVFQRVDLPEKPEIPALLEFVRETARCTRLVRQEASIQLVEHILSALHACGIHNLRIQVEGPEIPIGDGSANQFVRMIEEAGVQRLDAPLEILQIEQPIHWSEGEIHLVALPSKEFRISYTLYYPQSSLIGSQYFSSLISPETYKSQISMCRTFSLYEEIHPLIEKGFIKGGGLENALVIRENRVLNPDGARFPDEMVRHKVLDLVGDLALLGDPLHAHILAVRSGHTSNVAFAKAISNALKGALING
ncbi:MAG: UDP-3-O-[3-hydroxymyristoyl] N-acetylglucosamine deacetylase [Verrucomicrobiota bacterium]|nr:UDP-3-O-[3-hydroxymyristoyl] N-acetylglucosamine deacetylase [Verrucomicrobiota bacterium]